MQRIVVVDCCAMMKMILKECDEDAFAVSVVAALSSVSHRLPLAQKAMLKMKMAQHNISNVRSTW